MSYRYDEDILPEEDSDENLIIRHWRGHLSLPKSWFLVGGALGTVAILLLGGVLMMISQQASSLRIIAFAWLAFIMLFLVVRTWAIVGIWRSAGRHVSRGGSATWAGIAKVVLGFSVIASLGQARSYGTQALEYGKLAIGSDSLGNSAEVELAPNGHDITITGVLAAGTAEKFSSLLEKSSDIRTVILDSNGGRIFEAQKIAEAVKAHNLDTNVETRCESACTFVLLAGVSRTADTMARIGFHQPDFPGWSDDMRQEAIAANTRDYIAAGISPAFVSRMMETASSSMWYPEHDQLIAEGVLNGQSIVVGGKDMLSENMRDVASEMNKGTPRKLDNITELKSVTAKGHKVMIADTINVPVDGSRLASSRTAIRKDLLRNACGNSGMQALIRAGGSLVYTYSDREGRKLFDISITECS